MKPCRLAPLTGGLSLSKAGYISFVWRTILLVNFFALYVSATLKAGNIPSTGIESIRTNLYLLNADNTTQLMDGVLTEYSEAYHDSVYFEDAFKFTNITENLGLVRYGSVLSIERRPTIMNSDTLFFKLWRTTRRSYQFEFVTNNLYHPGMQAFLEDAYLNTSSMVALTGITKVAFIINTDAASANVNRFKIVYKTVVPAAVLPVDFTVVSAFQIDNKNQVQWEVENEVNIEKYVIERSTSGSGFISVDTIKANTINTANNTYMWVDHHTSQSNNYFYRIKSIGIDKVGRYSKIVQVTLPQHVFGAVFMYPNPVVNKTIKLKFNNRQPGIYQIKIMNTNAAVQYSQRLTNTGNLAQSINLSQTLAPGIYYLQIVAPDNTSITQKIVVQ